MSKLSLYVAQERPALYCGGDEEDNASTATNSQLQSKRRRFRVDGGGVNHLSSIAIVSALQKFMSIF